MMTVTGNIETPNREPLTGAPPTSEPITAQVRGGNGRPAIYKRAHSQGELLDRSALDGRTKCSDS
jgi:hypothetical protein